MFGLKTLKKTTKITLFVGTAIVLIGYTGTFTLAKSRLNLIAPNVFIGKIEVGGKTKEEAKQQINSEIDQIIVRGVQLSVDGKVATVPLSSLGSETNDYLTFDINQALDEAYSLHRPQSSFFLPFSFLSAVTHKSHTKIPIKLDEERLQKVVLNTFPDSIQPATNAGFAFSQITGVWQAAITPSAKGFTIPTDELFTQLEKLMADLDPQPIVFNRAYEEPIIKEDQLQPLLLLAEKVVNAAPFTITFENQTWNLAADNLTQILQPTIDQDKKISLTFSVEKMKNFFDEIAKTVEKPATDARLNMENERVIDFQPSVNGITIDREATAKTLTELLEKIPENKIINLVVKIVEPAVKIASVNTLGIKENLGTGSSNYKGSPTNRIKNIRNGVRLLNGLLIKPGEEFSLLNALKPFTQDNGYLPELVIKGDKIEPEIGGGLCQIGTTTFRAAMNSGLPITQRQNHSLVVRYYNDQSNNSPGTDATIYDPSPDLKFINDTGNYLLFQAEMDETGSNLNFSFWGTSDGRKGSYTPPILVRWIPVGEEQKIETTDLEPGKEKCQEAHVGADATFTYTIENADGSKNETVFDSHYRPLPRICLVGVEKIEEEPSTETSNSEITTPINAETPAATIE